jgi:type VI secretion system secreted protein Hcp
MKTLPSLSRTLALTVPAVALTLGSSQGASDYLLEIEGIKGESSDSKHADAIEIESFSWGATNSGSMARTITLALGKRIDKSSPQLFLRCAQGTHIPQAIITCRKTNGSGGKTDYYVVTLSDVMVSSYQSAGGGGGGGGAVGNTLPLDQISFNYQKIEFKYIRTDEAGEPSEEPVVVTHDFTGGAQ